MEDWNVGSYCLVVGRLESWLLFWLLVLKDWKVGLEGCFGVGLGRLVLGNWLLVGWKAGIGRLEGWYWYWKIGTLVVVLVVGIGRLEGWLLLLEDRKVACCCSKAGFVCFRLLELVLLGSWLLVVGRLVWEIGRLVVGIGRLEDWLVSHARPQGDGGLYIIHYTLYIIRYSLFIIDYTFYIIYYTLYIIHYTLYIIQCIIHHTLYIIHHTLYIIHYTLYIIHSTL